MPAWRGAAVLCELTGYGTSDDAYHISAPAENGAGAALSMQYALRNAGLDPEGIDYINAHGTSTLLNDKSETAAIKTVFGKKAGSIPVVVHKIHDRASTGKPPVLLKR